jgi:uncharacterized protein DUF4242
MGSPTWGVRLGNLGSFPDLRGAVHAYRPLQLNHGDNAMPRYVVERDFPDGLLVPIDENGAKACLAVVESNAADEVTWVHSYVSIDKKKSYCIYDGPSPEAIRRTASRNKLPVERITEVRILDPYFYK